jgi:hypothetical protein
MKPHFGVHDVDAAAASNLIESASRWMGLRLTARGVTALFSSAGDSKISSSFIEGRE